MIRVSYVVAAQKLARMDFLYQHFGRTENDRFSVTKSKICFLPKQLLPAGISYPEPRRDAYANQNKAAWMPDNKAPSEVAIHLPR